MIGIDTFSWSKLFLLEKHYGNNFIINLINQVRFFYTEEVEKELLYFHSKGSEIWRQGARLPRLDRSFIDYVIDGFDEADASLLEYSELPTYIIVTEDYPMLALNVTKRNNIIQVADLFLFFLNQSMISIKEFRDILSWLRENRNLTKRKFKRLSKAYSSPNL